MKKPPALRETFEYKKHARPVIKDPMFRTTNDGSHDWTSSRACNEFVSIKVNGGIFGCKNGVNNVDISAFNVSRMHLTLFPKDSGCRNNE